VAMNDVDLSALRRQSSSEAESKSNAPRRRLRWYVVAPALLALGFLWVFASSLVEFFEPVVEVSIVRPASAQSGEGQSGEGQRAGQLLFQAAGWVEPDPFAIQVPALTQGIVAELLVEEGDRVEEGQVIARLIAEDAELEHRSAIAKLEAAEVELERARELERILQRDFDAALAVTRDLRVHEAHVEAWAAKTKAARAAVETAREDLGVAQFELETQEFLRGKDANSKWELDLAIAKRNAQKARLAQREAELETLRAEQKREAAELARVQGDFELRSQERLELVRAQEQVRLSEALAQGARAARDIAALRLSRVQVRSPRAGIVLERQAEAGSSVGARCWRARLDLRPRATCASEWTFPRRRSLRPRAGSERRSAATSGAAGPIRARCCGSSTGRISKKSRSRSRCASRTRTSSSNRTCSARSRSTDRRERAAVRAARKRMLLRASSVSLRGF
jgi:multidrug efflux pump subunit AcrA (membrane-fusion protein)